VRPWAMDRNFADHLWHLSEKLTSMVFSELTMSVRHL